MVEYIFVAKIEVDITLCKGCGICVEMCPMKVLKMSEKFGPRGYHYPEVVHPEKCTKCRLCELYCPDFAISVEDEP